jgi:long-chain acyl-CoA synthetase
MHIDFLLSVFEDCKNDEAIVWRGRAYSYKWLIDSTKQWIEQLHENKIKKGSIVAVHGDFSPNSIALILALIHNNNIVVPLTQSVAANKDRFLEIAEVQYSISIDDYDNASYESIDKIVTKELLIKLQHKKMPGLVLFSSGSTGEPKAAVHDFVAILNKYKIRKQKKRMLTFLLFDHIGGVNTLFYILSNGGSIVTVQDRSPDEVLGAVEKYKVQILPTSPSFLNMILLSEAYKRYDLSSLERITYGTETMPESTLRAINRVFPQVMLQQTYGLSEVGILSSQSKSSDSLWVKIGGEGFKTRVVDGMLQIKAESAMLGYLNAPSPFTDDGWFITGDEVEIEGDYYLIKGRRSEIINVGGQKVYPAEVESVILQMDGVLDAVITGEKNPILGKIVTAKVHLADEEETVKDFTRRMKIYCKDKLQPFQVPQKITIEQKDFTNSRFKKIRK